MEKVGWGCAGDRSGLVGRKGTRSGEKQEKGTDQQKSYVGFRPLKV